MDLDFKIIKSQLGIPGDIVSKVVQLFEVEGNSKTTMASTQYQELEQFLIDTQSEVTRDIRIFCFVAKHLDILVRLKGNQFDLMAYEKLLKGIRGKG